MPYRPSDKPGKKARLKRRAFPIACYVGPNGHGKSACMVYDTLPSLDAGRPVLSTVRLLDYGNPRPCPGGDVCDDPDGHQGSRRTATVVDGRLVVGRVETGAVHAAAHPFYVRLTSYEQLMEWSDGDVLLDEVTGVASSREVSSMPVQIANMLVQLRRKNIALRWTAPNWTRADKIIREVTQAVTLCVGMMGKRRPPVPGEAPHLWTDRRLFRFRTFDAALMEDFEASQADSIQPDITQWKWRPGSVMERAYDTMDSVTTLGWANDAGLCLGCGGKRTIPRCSCADHGTGKGRAGRPKAEAGPVTAAAAGFGDLVGLYG